MKKLYKQFNNLNIDLDIQPMEVSEMEKERIKRNIMKGKKKNHLSRNLSVAAAFLVASSITLSLAFPTFAAKLPIIGNIFDLFGNDERYIFEDYDKYSTDIGVTKESNGISVTVTDAVYDGENITIAYMLKSEQDLGERPVLEGNVVVDEIGDRYEHSGYFENYIVEKINDNEYAVLYVYELIEGSKPDKVHITWQGDTIQNLSNVNQAFSGDWSFQFALDALDRKTTEFASEDIKSEDDGIEINLLTMTETPISSTLYLTEMVDERLVSQEDEEMRAVLIDYLVSDNLGNQYKSIHFRSTGHSTDFDKYHQSYPRITTSVIDEEATSLTITPVVNVSRVVGPDKDGQGPLELVMEPYTTKPIQVPLNK